MSELSDAVTKPETILEQRVRSILSSSRVASNVMSCCFNVFSESLILDGRVDAMCFLSSDTPLDIVTKPGSALTDSADEDDRDIDETLKGGTNGVNAGGPRAGAKVMFLILAPSEEELDSSDSLDVIERREDDELLR